MNVKDVFVVVLHYTYHDTTTHQPIQNSFTPSLPPSFFHFSPFTLHPSFFLFYIHHFYFLLTSSNPSLHFYPFQDYSFTSSHHTFRKGHPLSLFLFLTLSLFHSFTLLLSLKETTFYRLISWPQFTSSPNPTSFFFSLWVECYCCTWHLKGPPFSFFSEQHRLSAFFHACPFPPSKQPKLLTNQHPLSSFL